MTAAPGKGSRSALRGPFRVPPRSASRRAPERRAGLFAGQSRWHRAGSSLVGLLLAAGAGAFAAPSASAQSCPGSGECCAENGTPGCNDTPCCPQVCNLDPFCCLGAWDSFCASSAVELCSVCSASAYSGPGNCCSANGTPGCDDTGCCELVCVTDTFCCGNAWDQECAEAAATLCEASACSGAVCAGVGSCCESNGSPSCEAESCCAAVCVADAFCCDVTWDAQCAQEAASLCGVLCVAPDVPSSRLWGRALVTCLLAAAGLLAMRTRDARGAALKL